LAAALAAFALARAPPFALPPFAFPAAFTGTGGALGRSPRGPRPKPATAAPIPATGTPNAFARAAIILALAAAIAASLELLPKKAVKLVQLKINVLQESRRDSACRRKLPHLAEEEAQTADAKQFAVTSESAQAERTRWHVAPQAGTAAIS